MITIQANVIFRWTPSPRRVRRDQGYLDDEYDVRHGFSGGGGGPMDFVRQEFGRFGRAQSKYIPIRFNELQSEAASRPILKLK